MKRISLLMAVLLGISFLSLIAQEEKKEPLNIDIAKMQPRNNSREDHITLIDNDHTPVKKAKPKSENLRRPIELRGNSTESTRRIRDNDHQFWVQNQIRMARKNQILQRRKMQLERRKKMIERRKLYRERLQQRMIQRQRMRNSR